MAITKVPQPQLQDPFLDTAYIATLSLSAREAYHSTGGATVDWESRQLRDLAGVFNIVDWANQTLANSAGGVTLQWSFQRLLTAGTIVADWGTMVLNDSAGLASVDWTNRLLKKNTGVTFIDWQNGLINGAAYPPAPGGAAGGDLSGTYPNPTVAKVLGAATRTLADSAAVVAVNWETRILNDAAGALAVRWDSDRGLYSTAGIKVAQFSGASLRLYDAAGLQSVNWGSRILYDTANKESVVWNARGLEESTNTAYTVHWENLTLNNAVGTNILHWGTQTLANGNWNLSTGSFLINTIGQGLRIKTGANAKLGTAVLVAGTVTVANTSVTANSRIFLTSQVDGGTPSFLRITAITAATSFVITSGLAGDTSTVAWNIIESIP